MFCAAGYTHNPYNGVIYNDTILATGVFSSKELWRLSKSKLILLNFLGIARHALPYYLVR